MTEHQRVTADQRRRMRELRQQRMPLSAIARAVGLPKTTVYEHVRDIVVDYTLKDSVTWANPRR